MLASRRITTLWPEWLRARLEPRARAPHTHAAAVHPVAASGPAIAIGVGRRFPIAPQDARAYYRAADDVC